MIKRSSFIIYDELNLGSFPSSKIGRRIRFWAPEKLKQSKNSRIIEKTNLYDTGLVYDEFLIV